MSHRKMAVELNAMGVPDSAWRSVACRDGQASAETLGLASARCSIVAVGTLPISSAAGGEA
jgi:hypothetical protein